MRCHGTSPLEVSDVAKKWTGAFVNGPCVHVVDSSVVRALEGLWAAGQSLVSFAREIDFFRQE